MKVVFLTGSHPRHAHMARAISKTGFLAGLVIEQRESFVPEPPSDIPESTRKLFLQHFEGRDLAEGKFFGISDLPNVPALHVDMSELNTKSTVDFINEISPDLVLSYGVHKLTSSTLQSLNASLKWNIHGGLSPWYRGVITHFWPSYFLEPQMTGMTVHELTKEIDGGDVIHQSLAAMVRGDGVHDVACRAVLSLCDDMEQLMKVVQSGQIKEPAAQTTTGRIWRSVDWQPAHLHVVYEHYGNKIVDRYLDGEFKQSLPKIVRQF
jgi:folate-dependent phosphoribosylglycinamide formyltransferase PurN